MACQRACNVDLLKGAAMLEAASPAPRKSDKRDAGIV